jgi:nucleoside-diphosphate-sugar epimerase
MFCGEDDSSRKLLNLFKHIKKNQFFFLNKNATVNYVYVKYLTKIITQFVESEFFDNEIYNVNSPYSLVNFIDLIKNKMKLNSKNHFVPVYIKFIFLFISKIFTLLPAKFRIFDKYKYIELTNIKIYSTKKIDQLFNLDSEVFLKQGIENIIFYYKEKNLL